ncbi:MAG: hypothetical protein ABSD74_19300 [Rhizomicrobium sp.]|jgi:hypothetical protein
MTIEDEIEAELMVLCQEYEAWNKAQGLKLGSADEHLFDESLTEEQRAWVRDFSRRWDETAPVYTGAGCVRGRDARKHLR